jgi:ubiquinone/menaquinone biosynthesis C-methylase UbiE
MHDQRTVRELARQYDRLAGQYDAAMDRIERWLLGDWRAWAAHQAVGRTLEIAIGTGRTLPSYRPGIVLIGIDVSLGMLRVAQRRARAYGRPVTLLCADAQALPLRDASVDTVLSILSLCTIPDDQQALREAYRVLRPGGRLILVEHVRSDRRLLGLAQRLIEPLSVRFAHDHLAREPLPMVVANGFQVLQEQRRLAGIVQRILAVKPS